MQRLLTARRDSEASAPAEFPPEQPEADLAVPDEEEYGADEAAEEAEAEAEAEAEGSEKPAPAAGEDTEMGDGDQEAVNPGEDNEDVISEDGSVDLEGESEDELEDELAEGEGEGEGEGEEVEDHAMDVDADKPGHAAGAKPVSAAV